MSEDTMVCPRCGRPAGEMDSPVIEGLQGRGLLAYPLWVSRERLDRDDLADEMVYIGGASRAKEFAAHVTIYQCPCGLLLTDEGLVTISEWLGDNRPEPILEGD